MRIFLLLVLLPSVARGDLLLDAIYGRYNNPYSSSYSYSSSSEGETSENAYNDENGTNYDSEEPVHESWDNLYLCQYCDTEIIIDPYN